jgi:hypothetical protein
MRFRRVAAAFAAVAIVATAGVATAASSASAATPSCGGNCVDIFNRDLGTHRTPNFVLDVKQQSANTGQPIILWRQSNSDPAEDFTYAFQGLTSDFYAAGLVSAQVNLHYGNGSVTATDDPAFEVEYSPYGVNSGLCVGVASTAVQSEGVTLQPCGVSAKTVWIIDAADITGFNHNYAPLINGSDTSFSHPFVMTYPQDGYPTDTPRPQVLVRGLTGFSNSPLTVNSNQLWGADFGVLH